MASGVCVGKYFEIFQLSAFIIVWGFGFVFRLRVLFELELFLLWILHLHVLK